jgi:hypothetical protein
MCAQDELPPGAAGVLLNRTHLFQDLVLVITEQEKRIYEAIDGRRKISEIVEELNVDPAVARNYFQNLWWYDQVVFDTSNSRG